MNNRKVKATHPLYQQSELVEEQNKVKEESASKELKTMALNVMCKFVPGREDNQQIPTDTKSKEVLKSEKKELKEMCVIVGEEKGYQKMQTYAQQSEPVEKYGKLQKVMPQQGCMKSIKLNQKMNEDSFSIRAGKIFYGGMMLVNCDFVVSSVFVKNGYPIYEVAVDMNGRKITLQLSPTELFLGKWVFTKIPLCYSQFDIKKAEYLVGDYCKLLVAYLAEQGIEITEEQRFPGWTLVGGRFLYITPAGPINVNSQMKSSCGQLFNIRHDTRFGDFSIAQRLMKLTPRSPVAPVLFTYVIMSFLWSLYKERGITPKFSLFLSGKRGTMKTTLCLLLTQLERNDSPEYSMKSKSAGLESGYRQYKDAVMLIDDLSPVQDYTEKKRLLANLETVVRAFGDGSGKKRNYDFLSKDFSVEQYEARGGAVITGEFFEGCESSIARMLVLELKEGDVDTNLLTSLQSEKDVLSIFLYGFLSYITTNQEMILEMISNTVKEQRMRLVGRYTNLRYCEYQAQLNTAAEILVEYGFATGQLNLMECKSLRERLYSEIEKVVEKNSAELKEISPVTVVCQAFLEAVECQILLIFNFKQTKHSFDGCIIEDERNFFVQAKELLKLYENYSSAHGMSYFRYSTKSLSKTLVEEGVAEARMEGNKYRTSIKIPGSGNIRFLKLDKKKVYSLASQ